jgi:hypothetical protein
MIVMLPPVPANTNYRSLKIISMILLIFGVAALMFSIGWLVFTILIGGNMLDGLLYNTFYGQEKMGMLDYMSTLVSITIMVMGFAGSMGISLMSLAGSEAIRLMIDMRDDQHYVSQMMYLQASRVNERVK